MSRNILYRIGKKRYYKKSGSVKNGQNRVGEDNMTVITISKEYGTHGRALAGKLAEELGYEYVGNSLLADIARELNLSEGEAEVFSKAASSRILRLVDRYTCAIVQKVVDREHGCLDDDNYFNVTRKLVEKLYGAGNVIIMGWGSQCILKDRDHVLHVRLTKDMGAKIQAVMAGQNLDASAARRLVETEENDMKAYIRQHFNQDWNDIRLYDLVIDMGRNTVGQALKTICDNLKTGGLT
jgi:cytidylate kinase